MISGTIVVATADKPDKNANISIIALCDDFISSIRSIRIPFFFRDEFFRLRKQSLPKS